MFPFIITKEFMLFVFTNSSSDIIFLFPLAA